MISMGDDKEKGKRNEKGIILCVGRVTVKFCVRVK